MEQVRVVFEQQEYAALVRFAEKELRPLTIQIRAIVRDRLRGEGFFEHEKGGDAMLPPR